MVDDAYPARYRDRLGEVATTIYNNGRELRMHLRGVDFVGTMLDDFEPCLPYDAPALQPFTFEHTQQLTPPSTISPLWVLCDFTLEWRMAVSVMLNGERNPGSLWAHFELGRPRPDNRGIDREVLQLTLQVADRQFVSRGDVHGDAETELLDIHLQLPENMYMQTCLFCAFSDYAPWGKGEFGCLDCFRKAKQDYLAVTNKRELLALYGKKMHERVQETYCCPEFVRRTSTFGRPAKQVKA